jgi:8-oxo-dGTP pyrophosphatase MutT (NUDIX family)
LGLAEDIRRWVEAFDPGDDAPARASREAVLALLNGNPDPGARTGFQPGHVTASGLVLADDGRAVLLVLHARLGRWLQPGGHLEPSDDSVAGAARREVLEETGLALDPSDRPVLVAVDVHEIPAARGEPTHLHHDLMFGFVSPRSPLRPGPGALRAEWCPIETLGRLGVDAALRRALGRARGAALWQFRRAADSTSGCAEPRPPRWQPRG